MQARAVTGVAQVGSLAWRCAVYLAKPRPAPATVRLVKIEEFDERVDRVQSACRAAYPALLDRGSGALNIKFPRSDSRLQRYLFQEASEVRGWLAVMCNQLKDHKQFGDMRLGCIVDGLCAPELAPAALDLASRALTQAGADLIVSNQTHHSWQRGLSANLFVRGPSNFILARSTAFSPGVAMTDLHVHRGDGDGPINL